MHSSGVNGLPFSMPIDLSRSIIARSRSNQGSIWIMRWSERKKRTSYGIVLSKTTSMTSMKTVAGGFAADDNG